MMEAEEKYKDIINRTWPADPDIFLKHPRMPISERAKIFAPFAALRGHSDRLSEENGKLLKGERIDLSEEEVEILSGKLLQVKKEMDVTVVYFEPDSPGGNTGYYVSLTGTLAAFDPIYRLIRIATGEIGEKGEIMKTVKLDDLIDISGKDIVDVGQYL